MEGQSDKNEEVDTVTRLAKKFPWWVLKTLEDGKSVAVLNEEEAIMV